MNVESVFEYLNPHFKQELEFFSNLSLILNKLISREPFTDEENFIVSLDQPFQNFTNFGDSNYFEGRNGNNLQRRRSI